MMSPDHNNNKKAAVLEPAGKEESQGSGGKKSSTSRPPQEAALKCPRCDSQNTKFCYYNNYSLSQPRHFCKTCRRYWTRGGALRSVPIGGGCRKNKKTKHPSSSSSSSTSTSRDTSSNIGGLRFFQGLSPAMDFQLGGTNTSLFSSFGEIQLPIPIQKPIPATNSAANHCFSLENPSPTCSSSVLGFGIGTSSHGLFHQELGMGGGSFNKSFASSTIESLSSINQDMHWKLQQQRLAMLFVGERKHDRENDNNNNTTDDHHVLIPPSSPSTLNPKSSHNNLLFQNLDSSKPADQSCGIGPSIGTLSTEWFFDNSYAPIATASTNTNANENENEIEIPSSSSWSTGIQAWTDYTRYTGLP